jgi:pimeloyl-ACP methyl ester carboxylesterase
MWDIIVIVTITVLVSAILFFIASFFIVAHVLFTLHLKRKDKNAWSRDCEWDHPLLRQMHEEGLAWAGQHSQYRRNLHIVNEGLNLYGEYYDCGFNRAVIVVPGRTEALRYSYYFAKPYIDNGYNVLAIDQRSHGESDGVYNTLGFEEHKDVIAWGKLLHEVYGVEAIMLHGNCIGCSCCLQVLTSPVCPDYFVGMVAEGMYPNFYESFRNHMIEMKRPVHPCIDLVDMWMRFYTGHSMKIGPMDMIPNCDRPILMLHSLEDAYSLPSAAQELYDKCGSTKRLVWFTKGAHSQIRVNNPEQYDLAIGEFLQENLPQSA